MSPVALFHFVVAVGGHNSGFHHSKWSFLLHKIGHFSMIKTHSVCILGPEIMPKCSYVAPRGSLTNIKGCCRYFELNFHKIG